MSPFRWWRGGFRAPSTSTGSARRWRRSAWPASVSAGRAPSRSSSTPERRSPGRWSARPGLLVLDDPCAGVAGPARAGLLRDLLAAAEAIGAAVVLATGDPEDALSLGGAVGVLVAGRLLQHGPVQAVYDAPASAPVARLLGEANLLPGQVEAIEDDIARVRLAAGPVVAARARDGLGPGRACLVFVRPERVAVAAIDAADMGERALAAELLALDWRGDHVRLTLRLGAAGARPALLVVKRPAGAVLAGLGPGEHAAVAWQPHHAAVLPPDE